LEHFLIGPVPVAGVLLFSHEQLPVACAIPLAVTPPYVAFWHHIACRHHVFRRARCRLYKMSMRKIQKTAGELSPECSILSRKTFFFRPSELHRPGKNGNAANVE
jgi:hypothetical protein